MPRYRPAFWIALCWLAASLTWPGAADAQQCTAADAQDRRSPCKAWRTAEYMAALKTMRMEAVPSKYSGQGTTVVHIETEVPWMEAASSVTGERLFGDCSLPRDRGRDIGGYAPQGNSCRIKWVQCFGKNPFNQKNCEFALGPKQGHATSATQGLAMAAPETNIISLKLLAFNNDFFAEAIDWLLTPSAAFAGESPATHFNVVAVTVGWTVIVHFTPTQPRTELVGVFSKRCAVSNPDPSGPADQLRYVSDWLNAYNVNTQRFRYEAFDTHAQKLRAAGIIPLAGAMNYTTRLKTQDAKGRNIEQKFVSPNGIAFPACLDSYLAVGGIAPNYIDLQKRPNNRLQYLITNGHETLTDVVTPSGASSFSVPVTAAAVARLKSAELLPNADFAEIVRLLRTSANPPASAGYSCNPQDVFPPASLPDELNCPEAPPAWTLPVIDMAAATSAAERLRDAE